MVKGFRVILALVLFSMVVVAGCAPGRPEAGNDSAGAALSAEWAIVTGN